MGAHGRLICTFTLRAPTHRTGATRNILLIQRNGCQAERPLCGATVKRRAGTPPASRSGTSAIRLHSLTPRASRLCAQRPEGVRTVTSLTPDHREASGWELRTGRDDAVNCLAGCGRVGFVVDERFVGGGLGDAMGTVGRQCGQVVLLRLPFIVVPGIGSEDDERLRPGRGTWDRRHHRPCRNDGDEEQRPPPHPPPDMPVRRLIGDYGPWPLSRLRRRLRSGVVEMAKAAIVKSFFGALIGLDGIVLLLRVSRLTGGGGALV
jgi:hypothetical protein